MPKVTFARDEKVVETAAGAQTLLECSLGSGIPHMYACGGNAKCSTCRVLVVEGGEGLSGPTTAEEKLAKKKGFEPNIRLACQARAVGDVTVRRLVTDDRDADTAMAEDVAATRRATTGREAQVAVLFTDIRDFTPFVDANLPYDVIHLLGRFFQMAGEAVLGHGGFIDKYMGDGMMAIFGLGLETAADRGEAGKAACRAAVGAGLEIVERAEELDAYTRRHFNLGFHAGVGVHYGPALVGTFGHPSKMQFSAIGDTVNMASRVESATKVLKGLGDTTMSGMLVTDAVFDQVWDEVHVAKVVQSPLKGKKGEHVLFQVNGMLDIGIGQMNEGMKLSTIKRVLRGTVTRRLAPLFLRLSYHDAITYDVETREGGPDGSIRFPEELARPESKGLQVAIDLLQPVKEMLGEDASWADLIMVAGAVAVARTGGPDITVPLGRKDVGAAVKDGLMPSREWGPVETKAYFKRLGLDARLWTALSGAHTLGRLAGRPFTDDPFKFDNSFFKALAKLEPGYQLLPTDLALMQDEEAREWVQTYAADEGKFFADFTEAYLKMASLGSG